MSLLALATAVQCISVPEHHIYSISNTFMIQSSSNIADKHGFNKSWFYGQSKTRTEFFVVEIGGGGVVIYPRAGPSPSEVTCDIEVISIAMQGVGIREVVQNSSLRAPMV